MDIDKIVFILLIASTTLLFPIFQSPIQVNLLPNENEIIVVDIQQPDLRILVTGGSVNISVQELDGGYSSTLVNVDDVTLTGLNPGLYSVSITSKSLVSILLDGRGIYLRTYLILGFFGALTLWRVNKRFQQI